MSLYTDIHVLSAAMFRNIESCWHLFKRGTAGKISPVYVPGTGIYHLKWLHSNGLWSNFFNQAHQNNMSIMTIGKWCHLGSNVKWTFLEKGEPHLSLVMRKPAFCICENKDADQLRGNRQADQCLCFLYIASTIPLLPKYKISSL